MFDLDRWKEIFDAILKNKLRTFLTGLSVASGIFILVILLGFGQGMQNGIAKEFSNDSANRIFVWTWRTTKEHKGLNPGRRIVMNNENAAYIEKAFGEYLDAKSPLLRVQTTSITYGKEALGYRVHGVGADYQPIENAFMSEGRFLSDKDMAERAKVAVLSNKMKREVFKKDDEPLGKFIKISGVPFKIIGFYGDPGGDQEEQRIYIPFTTAQIVFNGSDTVNNLAYNLKPQATFDETVKASMDFSESLKTYLKQVHMVAPEDESAVRVFNTLEQAKRFHNLTGGIKLFFWFVGICTIVAGVVGVSNIMLIVVKERTKEIGVRKALGAKPWSIVTMIVQEAVFVTAVSGFGGLIFSMGLLELVGPNIEVDYILNPSVNFQVAITTVFLLIGAGVLAGFFPAWRAARMSTIDALRDE